MTINHEVLEENCDSFEVDFALAAIGAITHLLAACGTCEYYDEMNSDETQSMVAGMFEHIHSTLRNTTSKPLTFAYATLGLSMGNYWFTLFDQDLLKSSLKKLELSRNEKLDLLEKVKESIEEFNDSVQDCQLMMELAITASDIIFSRE